MILKAGGVKAPAVVAGADVVVGIINLRAAVSANNRETDDNS